MSEMAPIHLVQTGRTTWSIEGRLQGRADQYRDLPLRRSGT
jgi:broad specificity phosphatase PhoE